MTTILGILGTSTPVSEKLADELGYVRAAIACRVFFYQQMEDRICTASIATLAKKLGMSTGTVSSNLTWLRENGYVVSVGDHKSGNVVNFYKVGPRFYNSLNREHSADESNIQQMNDNIQQMNGKEEFKEEIKETITNGGLDPIFARVCTVYENEIGFLSPKISSLIKELLLDYPPDWITEAIGIAVKANARKLSYVNGILQRWKTDGRQPIKKTINGKVVHKIV